jgi:DNA-binding transcriptional MerR regulator
MLKSDLIQTDKHSIKILLRRKNLRFLRRTNLIQNRYHTFENYRIYKEKLFDFDN